ncbi:thiamine-phosphate kinase [Gordonia liuliyuniae]|uniref:Thiamine-monophosphate kinase n=1 Tax=Gordonia liuliyuniae TaxID=2911517 RepID=A0ABS9IVI8_9ACTN|nr:thiamine-phosphate kinase [Gordonia liuliyuniae]MCF8589510.1 thiamine-phosphate kinase [Gordonia liuliyuniae]
MQTVSEVGERRLIAMFTEAAASTDDDVVIGSGDDAAVFTAQGPVVVSTDTAVAGRHFRFDWSSPEQIGARAVVQSAADIAAMGGRLTGVTVSLGCPPETSVDRLLAVNSGIVDQTHAYRARVLGGDLVSAPTVVITVTSIGVLDDVAPVTLSGARSGEVLAVSGPLGGAAGGLAVLSAVEHGADPALVDRHPVALAAYRLPQPDLGAGPRAAAARATAMTDVSDGLVEELVTLAASSNVRLDVESALVPRVAGLDAVGEDLAVDPVRWALGGGEDHVLLAAFASGTVPADWTPIGVVSAGSGAFVDGEPVGSIRGWQSFTQT